MLPLFNIWRALVQWLKLPAWKVGDQGCKPHCGLQVSKKQKFPFPLTRDDSLLLAPPDREVACATSDRQGSNFESCVRRRVSSHSYHYPQEVLLAQFSLYVHKGGQQPHSFHFISRKEFTLSMIISLHRT